MLKDITDVRMSDNDKRLLLMCRDFRGQPEAHNILDFDAKDLYTIIIEAYKFGRNEKAAEIRKVMESK
tara:strand:+ start:216 stop:419 length:204 start_codon:yes stop_codon:yes gene_type:complete